MSLRPDRPRAMAAAIGFVLLPSLGCSWIFVNKPPTPPIDTTPPIECQSAAPLFPVFDTAGAVLLGLSGAAVTLYGLSAHSPPNCSGWIDLSCLSPERRTETTLAGVAILGAAVALGFSAAYGYSAVDECRGRQDVQLQLNCTSGVEEACRTLKERK